MILQSSSEIVGGLGITGNLAALLVGLYYGYKLWNDIHERKKQGPMNGHGAQLERERIANRIVERVDNRSEMLKGEIGITRHDLRNHLNSSILQGTSEMREIRDGVDAMSRLLAEKLDDIKEAILVLPQKIMGRS